MKREHVTLPAESEIKFFEADREKWQAGGIKFLDFWDKIKKNDVSRVVIEENVGKIQALFLGEKPTVLIGRGVAFVKESLELAGYKCIGKYVYDRTQVQKVVDDNREVFLQEVGFDSADEIMQIIQAKPDPELSLVRGLVLGFPYSAAREFADNIGAMSKIEEVVDRLSKLLKADGESTEQINLNYHGGAKYGNSDLINFLKTKIKFYQIKLNLNSSEMEELFGVLALFLHYKIVDIRGITWRDAVNPKADSIKIQTRLRAAFDYYDNVTLSQKKTPGPRVEI